MSTSKKMVATRKDPAVLVRFPKPLLKKVDSAKAASGRSRNTEILHLVSKALQSDGTQSAVTAS